MGACASSAAHHQGTGPGASEHVMPPCALAAKPAWGDSAAYAAWVADSHAVKYKGLDDASTPPASSRLGAAWSEVRNRYIVGVSFRTGQLLQADHAA